MKSLCICHVISVLCNWEIKFLLSSIITLAVFSNFKWLSSLHNTICLWNTTIFVTLKHKINNNKLTESFMTHQNSRFWVNEISTFKGWQNQQLHTFAYIFFHYYSKLQLVFRNAKTSFQINVVWIPENDAYLFPFHATLQYLKRLYVVFRVGRVSYTLPMQ